MATTKGERRYAHHDAKQDSQEDSQKEAQHYTDLLRSVFALHADGERAPAMEAYMRNQFPFYGISSVPRGELLRAFIAEHGLPDADVLVDVVRLLWMESRRELQYAALDLMYKQRRTLKQNHISLVEHCITHKSWWDTVDALAPRVAGYLYTEYTDGMGAKISEWIESENFWLNRSAIILQLGFKQRTDTDLLTRAILPHISSREFFVQKAIGWALRQYSYTDAVWVREFVQTHQLAPLSVREALKAIRRSSGRG